MSFGFASATEIIFGPGSLKKALGAARALHAVGSKALVIAGSAQRCLPLTNQLEEAKIPFVHYTVQGEPSTEVADKGAQLARDEKCDFVVAFGGGSVMDTGKAIAMLVKNGGQCLDYMEVIGKGQKITKKSLPLIAIATTSGTGSEVTKNAVMASLKHKQKASLRSPFMYPTVAVVDPELCLSVPPAVTAATGMDAFCQCLEPYTSKLSNPLTDAIAIKGLLHGARAIRKAYTQGNDIEARTDMALCSLFGGLSLANSKLGAAHGFAGPLGGLLPQASHGGIIGALLPSCIVTNVLAMQAREPSNPAIGKYRDAACTVLGRPDATAGELATWVAETCQLMKIPPLSAYGLTDDMIPAAVKAAAGSSSMKGNPIALTTEELTSILTQACTPALVNAKL
mmetsp:Transcript_28669/g.56324  ORF Transcript_28669/g.56324 Transcript_28669/m.56324 type:complete len:397 (-) Transcript_28669:66-1256(-)|eukprot:CAMPEP_0175155430 /NCGR_PEP_ID=MMETSP0087-20121206/20975_1 /TAXON_ID=136419 /ORGANISM="Unknown Unknown, Strain D1" /LENGTH=396 /DNA_ID=CAMNT_0016442593 /DNA_START=32 /DNA_END=1222 /DNA_ORIENTATION=-